MTRTSHVTVRQVPPGWEDLGGDTVCGDCDLLFLSLLLSFPTSSPPWKSHQAGSNVPASTEQQGLEGQWGKGWRGTL